LKLRKQKQENDTVQQDAQWKKIPLGLCAINQRLQKQEWIILIIHCFEDTVHFSVSVKTVELKKGQGRFGVELVYFRHY